MDSCLARLSGQMPEFKYQAIYSKQFSDFLLVQGQES